MQLFENAFKQCSSWIMSPNACKVRVSFQEAGVFAAWRAKFQYQFWLMATSSLHSCFYRTTTFFTFSWECQEKPLSLLIFGITVDKIVLSAKKTQLPLSYFPLLHCAGKGLRGALKKEKSIRSARLPPVMIRSTPTLLPHVQESEFTGQQLQPERAHTPH